MYRVILPLNARNKLVPGLLAYNLHYSTQLRILRKTTPLQLHSQKSSISCRHYIASI